MSFKDIDFENDSIAWVCHFGSEMRNRYIIEGFYKAAKTIYESIKEDSSYLYEDNMVYSFLHLIRHTYELQLKWIIYNMRCFYVEHKKDKVDFDLAKYDRIKFSHDIGLLYSFVEEYFQKLDERCNNIHLNFILLLRQYIEDFIPEGDKDPYRYAEDKDGNENLSTLEQVSYDKAISDLEKFKSSSDYVLFFLSQLEKEYQLGTHIRGLSRIQILKIAKELPPYSKWKETSFDITRNELCSKYSLTHKALSDVINTIKNSRWLSYYIDYNRRNYESEFSLLVKAIKFNINSNQSMPNTISDSNIIQFFSAVERSHTEASDFIDNLSFDDIITIHVYYRMGHEMYNPENYEEILADTKNRIFNDGLSAGNKAYFRSKLTGRSFVNNIMYGVYDSGDYELFIKLVNYLKGTKLQSETKEYEALLGELTSDSNR